MEEPAMVAMEELEQQPQQPAMAEVQVDDRRRTVYGDVALHALTAGSLGLDFATPKGSDPSTTEPIFVSGIVPGSPAERAGFRWVGAELLSVQGQSVEGLSFDAAISAIIAAQRCVRWPAICS